jgi:hypothetical protein
MRRCLLIGGAHCVLAVAKPEQGTNQQATEQLAKKATEIVTTRCAVPYMVPWRYGPGQWIAVSSHPHSTALAIAVWLHFESESLAFCGLATIARKGCDVDKYFLSANFGSNEAKASLSVPLL